MAATEHWLEIRAEAGEGWCKTRRGAGLGLLEDGQDMAVAESGRLHVDLPRVVWEKILFLATVNFRGDYRAKPIDIVSR